MRTRAHVFYNSTMNCLHCKKETNNPKFCSRSCSASWTNSQSPKRKRKTYICNDCSSTIDRRSYKDSTRICKTCLRERDIKSKTLGEYKERASVKGKHPSWVFSGVRGLNRSWNKDLISKPCANCGYDKHVELCHIKPLSEFSDDTPLSEANHRNNNVQLCRNCHWEFDNGILSIEEIKEH